MEDVVMVLLGLKVNYDQHFIKFIGRKIKLIETSNFRKNTFKSPIISKQILNCKTPLKQVYNTPINPILKTECGGGEYQRIKVWRSRVYPLG